MYRMKQWFGMKVSFLFLTTIAISFFTKANGYEIKVHINGLKDTICYLGYHFGDKQMIKDTIPLDHNGWGAFKGKDSFFSKIQ